jgi:phospho-N-acetylmuramoyl-pentapeptide-transferase
MTGFGAMLAAAIAFIVTAVSGIYLIPYLKRLKFGQSIKEIGPVWHKGKQGTPVMGGLMFITGILAAMAVVFAVYFRDILPGERIRLACALLMALAFGLIGFMDDYVKVVKKRNLGLTVRQKFSLQILAACVFLAVAYFSGARGTTMTLPFFNIGLPLGVFYWPVSLFVIVGCVNSVNLTDGIDGLAASVTFVAALAFMLCAKIAGHPGYAALSAALAGGMVGFLVWNFHPAKVFMGDTGSLFLGGLVCAVAYGINEPLLLIPIGIVYICETLSDIIQITSFKTTGRRVFKMSPIHHHFEMSGWSEVKIVGVFSLVTAVCSVAAVVWLAVYMGGI